MDNQAPGANLSADQLSAKLVGRWPSGALWSAFPGFPNTPLRPSPTPR